MSPEEVDLALASEDIVAVCRALRFLAGPRAGPRYPQARVRGLLGPLQPDRVRENALRVLLRRGLHPLEDRRVVDLLSTASRGLFAAALGVVVQVSYPSAAEDTLSWCWERRVHNDDRLAVLRHLEALGPRIAKRFVGRTRLLACGQPLLVSAGLALLSKASSADVHQLFEKALRHQNPRYRSMAVEYLAPRWSKAARRQRLRPFLADENHRVRSTAAVLQHDVSPDEAFEVLLRMSRDETALTRAAATWGLAELIGKDVRCRAALRKLEDDGDLRVARRARRALAA